MNNNPESFEQEVEQPSTTRLVDSHLEQMDEKQRELLRKLENSEYPAMVNTLREYSSGHDIVVAMGFTEVFKTMPSWEEIQKQLTPEILAKALKLEEPTLIMVPPLRRQNMVRALNAHKVQGQEHDTYTYELDNDALWNGGKPETADAWEVVIVTGVQDVKADEAITGTNYQKAKAWVKKYADQGVDVMNDARTYVVLMMRSLQVGKPIDEKTGTVLNAKNLTESSLVAFGFWDGDQVDLGSDGPAFEDVNLRSRGAVRVM